MKRLLFSAVCVVFAGPAIASADNFSMIGPRGQYTFGSVNNYGGTVNGWYMQNGQYSQFWYQQTPQYVYPSVYLNRPQPLVRTPYLRWGW